MNHGGTAMIAGPEVTPPRPVSDLVTMDVPAPY
jgi:hypothetical protein